MSRNKSLLFIIIVLIFVFSRNLFSEEKRGAELRILKTDGQKIKGELIAVKETALLLLESTTSADVSVNLVDIMSIEVIKQPKILLGAGLGLLIGGSVGALTGVMFGEDAPENGETSEEYETRSVSQKAITIGVLFGLIGAIGGGITGANIGSGGTIQIQGSPEDKINRELDRLRLKSRVPDYR